MAETERVGELHTIGAQVGCWGKNIQVRYVHHNEDCV